MTRHPVSFIRPVSKGRPKCPDKERYFVVDLAAYLRVTTRVITIFAKKKKIARGAWIVHRRNDVRKVMWLTRRGARLVLEHFRALQGKAWLAGCDWYAQRQRHCEAQARFEAKMRALRGPAERKPPRIPWRLPGPKPSPSTERPFSYKGRL